MSTNPTTENKALATIEDATAPTQFTGINRAQLDLLKRTLAKGTTDDEFALFMNTSTRLGIDPFARQIYAVKRWSPDEQKEVMAIQIGIDGFRAIADATADYQGQEGPFWCGDDGVWREAWISDKPPAAAKVTIFRKGVERGFVGVARYRSFVQTKKDGGPVRMWQTMPDVMLAKCAEAQALRKAFPRQLSGVQTDDEMGQAGEPAPTVEVGKLPIVEAKATEQPAPPAQPKPSADTWPALLADLARLVPEPLAIEIGKPVEEWGTAEVELAMSKLLATCTTTAACDKTLGPWGAVLHKHARPGSRANTVTEGFRAVYKAKLIELKSKAEAAGAPA